MALINSLFSSNLSTSTVITLLHLLLLLPVPLCCLNHYPQPPPDSTAHQGLLVEEKTRLGSTPPSCYNKCNKCHPCMAVQVPTLPSHGQEQPPSVVAAAAATPNPFKVPHVDYSASSSSSSTPSLGEGNRYSNYKPLGWKCRCNGHFYNP